MFDKLKSVIIAAAAIVAIIPGIGVVTGAIELPAAFDTLIGLMASIVGPVVFFLIFLAKPSIARLPRGMLIGLIAISAIGGLGALFVTNEYASERTTEYLYQDSEGVTQTRPFLLPEKYRTDLQQRIDREGGNVMNAIKRDRETTLRMLERDARSVRIKTVLGFLLAQILIIIAFLVAAWAVAMRGDENEETR